MAFVHLRTHTEFSVVDGTLRVDDAVSAAAADGQAALAITDLSNLFGAIKFYSAARKAGVKPIVGADVWLEPEGSEKSPARIVLLVSSRQGYLNLSELLSRAWLQGGQKTHATVHRAWLAELGDGLIALSGAEYGPIGHALAALGLEADLDADDRLHAGGAGSAVELDRAEQVAEVGDRQRPLAVGGRGGHGLVDAQGSVDDRELGVDAQVDEGHGRHFRDRSRPFPLGETLFHTQKRDFR